MATQVQFRGGTTTEHASFNGAAREVTVDTTKQTLVVQDGSTNGGFPLLKEKNADNVKVYFGTGDDLSVWHDGADSIISNATGVLKTHSSHFYVRNAAGTETNIECHPNAAVNLFYDNSKKLETTSAGVNISGDLQLQGADGTVDWVKWSKADYILTIKDGANLEFGNSRDLKIYHDGSNNIISGTSNTWIKNTGTQGFTAGSDYQLKCIADGAVELFYDGGKKLETTSTGATVTGDLVPEANATRALGSGSLRWAGAHITALRIYTDTQYYDNSVAKFGHGEDLQIYHDGSNSYLYQNGTGELRANAAAFRVMDRNGGETQLLASENGAVELYYDNVKKFQTISAGAEVHGSLYLSANSNMHFSDTNKAAFGDGGDLQIYHDGSNSWIRDTGTGKLIIDGSELTFNKTGNQDYYCRMIADGAVELYYDGSVKFQTTSVGATLTGRLSGWYDASQVAGLYLRNSNDSGTAVQFVKNDGGVVGSISQTASATSYNTSSDYRLKENEVAISDGITRLKTLKPYRFNFKDEPSKTVDGFFAHEVSPAVPEAIAGEKDGTEMQQLDYSKLSTLTIAALQEAITKIETLETKVAALESS